MKVISSIMPLSISWDEPEINDKWFLNAATSLRARGGTKTQRTLFFAGKSLLVFIALIMTCLIIVFYSIYFRINFILHKVIEFFFNVLQAFAIKTFEVVMDKVVGPILLISSLVIGILLIYVAYQTGTLTKIIEIIKTLFL